MDERALLRRLLAGPAPGEELARASGQTRAAVWKRIQALRDAGLSIEARPGRGYALAQPLELLDEAAIRAALASPVRSQMAGLEVAWSIDSTNSEMLRRPSPVAGTAVLLAEGQTGGRGRRGRGWASPMAAHVYLSLSRRFSGGLARLGGLSLVAGIVVAEALQALGVENVRLKWPNDLVVVDSDGGLRKLGGLLVEGGGEHAGPARAVIGLGLNVRMPDAAAAAIDQPWCDLAGLLRAQLPDRNMLVAVLLDRLLPALEQFDAAGLAPFLPRYAGLDALASRQVTVQGDSSAQTGLALGLAEDGALRVRYADGSVNHFHAGEVSVRPRGTRA